MPYCHHKDDDIYMNTRRMALMCSMELFFPPYNKLVLFGWIIDMASGQSKGSLRMDGMPLHAII